jgi:penicillin-binding protein 1C
VGVTPRYVVGVWAGNADGEGRAGLIGIKAAAPVLFEIFDVLPDASTWFKKPIQNMKYLTVCRKTGFLASEICPQKDSVLMPLNGERSDVCPFHKLIHLDKSEQFQVNSDCESPFNILTKPWFVLPPSAEKYYKIKHADYMFLPPLRNDCADKSETVVKNLEILYPYTGTKIYVPVELNGKAGRTVFEAAHRLSDAVIYWYIDNQLVAETRKIHQVELNPDFGKHTLTIVDGAGEKLSRNFEIISKAKK